MRKVLLIIIALLLCSVSYADTIHDEGYGLGYINSRFLKLDGTNSASATGVFDFGALTSFEIPNTAGNVTCDAAGEIAIDTTNKQFAVYDGANEVSIPLRNIAQGTFDFHSLYSSLPAGKEIWLMDLHADTFPNGIVITLVTVDSSAADPATELTGDLKSCDNVGGGAFPGANAAVIVAIDTTTGNYTSGAITTAVATGKSLYILLDADPTDANTVYHVRIHYRIPES